MNPKGLAYLLAAGRTLIGIGLMTAPELVGKGWMGKKSKDPRIKLLLRVVGIRDFVVGLGGVLALSREGGGARGWILAGAACDTIDGAATALARDDLDDGAATQLLAIAAPAAIAGPVVAAMLDD
ncbi:MAG: hypothetical protein H0V29_13550 [Thermoleophilaceae bacterium]|nr:hypothetical protein [Thermoleophilaceae bacterium]